jgi:PPM family protein phosphatase
VTGFDSIEHASLSDVGVRRSHNQDNHAVLLARDENQWRTRGHIFLVADGMGAHAVGELASELAVGIIPHTFAKHAETGAAGALRKAFIEANASIHARGQQNREFEGMGTTTTALILRPEGAWIGHVGDSRAYRIRKGKIEQLSFDHSLVWEFARRQRVDPDAVQGIPSNVIIRSLGPEPLVQVDVEGPHPIQDGDVFLVCSDGLSGQVTDHELGAVLSTLPPAEACQFLVDLAHLRGGPDNITLQIIHVGSGEKAPAVKGPSLWQRIPWSIKLLCVGTVFAASAIALSFNRVSGGGFLFFVASIIIISSLVGLILQVQRDKKKKSDDSDHPPPQIYRSSTCLIEKPLLDKLIRANQAVRDHALEKQWDVDWDGYHVQQEFADSLRHQGDLDSSFREFCRAMRILLEALHRQRNKEEVFQPVWDKT